jgi:hypothetical protein
VDQEQQADIGRDGVIGGPGDDTGAAVVAFRDDFAGEACGEQRTAADAGSLDGVEAGMAGGQPVHRGFGVAGQDGAGQRVEVIFVSEQQHSGDAVQFRALADRRRQQLAGCEFHAYAADLFTLGLRAGPHEHGQAC